MFQAMSALAVRREDAHQLPYFVRKRVENIPPKLKDAWEAKDYNAVLFYSLERDEEIEDLSRMFGANEEGIILDYAKKYNISVHDVFVRAVQHGEMNIYDDFDTMMEYAAIGGHEDIVRLAKEWGATEFDNSMISTNNVNIAKLCLEWGATEFDLLAESAAEKGNEEILSLSRDWGVFDFQNLLTKAFLFARPCTARLCKEFGATDFDTPMLYAAQYGDEDAFQLAIDLGATNFNVALTGAFNYGREEMVRKCIEYGAVITFSACWTNHEDIFDDGYLINVFEDLGESSLMITCTYINERKKILYRQEGICGVSSIRTPEDIIRSWDEMVQSYIDMSPPNFTGAPIITAFYANKTLADFYLADTAEYVPNRLFQALEAEAHATT